MSVQNQTGFLGFPVPIGVIFPFAGLEVPETYLVCDGSAFDQNKYPDLFRLLGNVSNTPNLVEGSISGGNASQFHPADVVTNPSALLFIDSDSMPSFTANVTGITGSGTLNGRALTTENESKPEIGGSSTNSGINAGTDETGTFPLTINSFSAVYNGGSQPSTTVPQDLVFNPRYTEIQYIIKASYY